MTTAASRNGFPHDPRSAAELYLAKGLTPIPLPPRSKDPGYRGWPDLRLSLDALDDHFPQHQARNVGILNGAPSGNVLDVDLDCLQAVLAAPLLLPKTGWVFGRTSAPSSHRIYRADRSLAAAQEKYTDLDGAVLVELRGTGGLTVYPPSTHKDTGERIAWEKFDDPAAVTLADLQQAVREVAAVALLARHWPTEGTRQDAFLALAGGLLRAGWPTDRTERLVAALAAATRDEEPAKRAQAVAATADKLGQNGRATGWPKLEELLGRDGRPVVKRCQEWLGLVRPPPTTDTAGPKTVRELPAYQPFPVEALPAPIREFVRQGALALGCDPAYLALPALAAAAAAIGNTRAIRLKRGWEEPSVIWSVIVGESGTLKSPAYAKAVAHLFRVQKRLLHEFRERHAQYERDLEAYQAAKKKGADPGDPPEQPVYRRVIISDITIEKVAEVLEDNPRGVLVARDELAGWLGSFTRYKGKQGGSDLPHWLEIHRAGTIVVDRKTGPRTHYFVERAAASVTGGIQPGVLARALTAEVLDAGGGARVLMAMPPRLPKRWSEVEVSPEVEDAYHAALDQLQSLDFAEKDGEPVPYVLRLSPEAKEAWKEFYDRWAKEQAAVEGELAAAFSKLEGYAARFALLHHVVTLTGLGSDDTAHPVGAKCVEAGVTLCHWFANEARRIYATLAETEEERDARRLVEYVRSRGGRVTARALQKSNSRKYPDAATARAALEALARAGLGHWTEPEAGPRGGQPAVWFVLHAGPTPDTTDTTPDGEDDGDGFGARHNPPPPDTTPQNAGEKPGCVGSVGRRVGPGTEESGGADGPPEEWFAPGATGVVPGAAGGDDGAAPGAGSPMDTPSAYVLVTHAADLAMVATAVEQSALVGLDCETTGLDPRADRVRLLALCCDALDGGTATYLVDCFAVADLSALWEQLSSVPVVGHNLAFDLQFLARLGFEPGPCRDTMLMSQVLHAGERGLKHSLAACCARELGEAVGKEEQASDWSGDLTQDQLRYAALDAELARRLHDALVPRLKVAGLTEAAAVENGALPAVAWLSVTGVGFDKDCWTALAEQAQAQADRLALELDAAAPKPAQPEMFGSGWNWDSSQSVQEALAAVGCPVEDTNDNTLAALAHPLAGLVRHYRAARKLTGTYGAKWLEYVAADGRVYAGWRQLGADSGRMACSQPNLQNLPRDARYRRCFVAPPGRVLVKADYSQIELRIAAQVAGEDRMIEAYRRGEDLHTLTARQILGTEDVSKADRQLAKAVNFGLLYGMGAPGFRVYARSHYGVELTEAQAQRYRDAFFAAYPGLRRWHREVGRSADRPVATRTRTGRRRLGVVRFNDKLNCPVQGSGADGLKRALALLWERRGECPGAMPVLVVHDEIVVECDADRAQAAAEGLKRAMLDGMAPLVAPVPVEVEVKTAHTWGGDT
jgi:DNA polymerase I-like protein with 3'-5' exonuclease and polymerase domains